MGKILGIIGGGQLGMMLTEAAKNMPLDISKIIVLDPTENCPASKVGAEQIVADFKDESSIRELAERSDIITYEIESGNSTVLKKLEPTCEINPSPETLKIIQDKLTQKKFLEENNIPVAKFSEILSITDLETKISEFGLPVLLKVRKDAYDGRGNFKINSTEQIIDAMNVFEGKSLMVEEFVDFKMEVSVIAARNTNGEIQTYPVVENMHEDNILKMTIAPARISEEVSKNAEEIAHKTMEVLHGAGVFGIEMFVTNTNKVLINEIAPRVHNSGHLTINAYNISQFENHVRAVCQLDKVELKKISNAEMINVIGKEITNYQNKKFSKNEFFFDYLKETIKDKRKMGHLTILKD